MPSAADLLRTARLASSPSGTRISSAELRAAFEAATAAQAGDPAGKPLTAEEAELFKSLKPEELTWFADRYVLQQILRDIPGLTQTGVTPPPQPGAQVSALPVKRGHEVFISTTAGFAMDAAGKAPATAVELTATLHNAGKWMQASFGTNENIFKTANLDAAGKTAALKQLKDALNADLSSLSAPQREQLLGSVAALTTELMKSIEFVPHMPTANAELIALRDQAFTTLKAALDHPQASVLVKRGMVGYLEKSDSVQAKLTQAQRAEITTRHHALFPRAPADYAKWEAQHKDRIVVDHVSGAGENFLFGFVKQLQSTGLDSGRTGSPRFTLVSGDAKHGPAVLETKVPANHPLNKWGREMTIEVRVRDMNRDMYRGMGDASVDVVHYGGHSNFGNNTLQSLRNAPAQNGDKIVLRDLCAGSDTKNAEAHVYPEGALNSVTSVGSSYFRTTHDPEMGKYAYESEGYEMLMSVTRGLLAKEDWQTVGEDLQDRANWWGHDSHNNWTHPGDPRVGAQVDDDDDGVPNIFDILPAYDTTDIAASTAAEFDLTAPSLKADEINGRRVFQALQFVNTAAAYNPDLKRTNTERLVHPDPNGMFFDAKDAPNEYVKWRKGPNGERFAQVSSALADMTIESLRAVVFFELVRQVGKENPSMFQSDAQRTAMALVFTAAALEYDDSWRDGEIFEGIKKLYAIPANVQLHDVNTALSAADTARHNYTGDMQAARDVVAKYGTELAGTNVGRPAITVT